MDILHCMKMDGSFWINRNVFLLKQECRFTRLYGYIESNAMGWNLLCIIFAKLVSNLPYGCQEHCMSRYYIPLYNSYLTSYWTMMMANNGHYLYMLNKYETFIYWTKNNSKTCLPNGKDSGLSLLGKNMKTYNKLVISR